MPLATTLRSIAETNQSAWPLRIYIISPGFSENMKKKIARSLPDDSCSIEWVSADMAQFDGFSTLGHISSTTYARLLLANILPVEIPKALYLDADLLVLDDLEPILKADLDGAVLGAVVDERLAGHVKMGNTSLGGKPLPQVADYFNAGVLLIDVAKWRTERIPEKALEYLKRYPDSLYSDQDALNFACDRRWKRLDPRWNYYQIDLEKPVSYLSPAQRPGIFHFHGCLKPWDPKSLNIHAGFYDSFRKRTLFARTRAEKLKSVPIATWSRLKRILKQSTIIRRVWSRMQSLQAENARKRVSA